MITCVENETRFAMNDLEHISGCGWDYVGRKRLEHASRGSCKDEERGKLGIEPLAKGISGQ